MLKHFSKLWCSMAHRQAYCKPPERGMTVTKQINLYRLKDRVVFHVTGKGPPDIALTADQARAFASQLNIYASEMDKTGFTDSRLGMAKVYIE